MGEPIASQLMLGLNLDGVASQVKKGETTYALNAAVQNFDGNVLAYQNEEGNKPCLSNLPLNAKIVGQKHIPEKQLFVLFLTINGNSEIGTVENCTYETILNSTCLDFNINTPVHDIVHRLSNNGDIEIYWAQSGSALKYLNFGKLPYKSDIQNCDQNSSLEIDCNKLNIFPSLKFPKVQVDEIISSGNLIEGTYQFGIQFANENGEPYTSIYYISSPVSVKNDTVFSQNFNENTGKSIALTLTNLDSSGIYDHINLVVVKKVNGITNLELIGTYVIAGNSFPIVYSGQSQPIRLSPEELFERFERYETASGITSVSDILVFYNVETKRRINFQKIWNAVNLQWETIRLPKSLNYADGLINSKYKGYFRDEVYAFEGAFIYSNGTTSDYFHIPSRLIKESDKEIISNSDTLDETDECKTSPDNRRFKVYNTASVLVTNELSSDPCVPETYQIGEFAYHESTDRYPCNPDIWGELANTPIRHHKFPDCLISPIHDDEGNIYPLGVRLNIEAIQDSINNSDLDDFVKRDIVGISLARGNRATNKTIVAKGLIYNVGEYKKNNQTFLFPNYPYNDLREDPFLSTEQTNDDSGNNSSLRLKAFISQETKRNFTFHSPDTHFYQPALGTSLKVETIEYGISQSNFVQVDKHAKYKVGTTAGFASLFTTLVAASFLRNALYGGLTAILTAPATFPDVLAAMTAYAQLRQTLINTMPRINYAYQFNGVGNYSKSLAVPNDGNKQRSLVAKRYITSGYEALEGGGFLNNLHRESSVYLKTKTSLLFPHEMGAPVDESRFLLACEEFDKIQEKPISSYYVSLKNDIPNPYGTIYSYESLSLGEPHLLTEGRKTATFFGGDCFISRMGLKRKFAFFTDNRVNFPDESDIEYRDVANVAYPTYWFSTSAKAGDGLTYGGIFGGIFGAMANNFICPGSKVFYQTGKFLLFAYGIPYFYTESEVNLDLRNATNSDKGNFYPNVGTGIPNQWLQESLISIVNDNIYSYNKTFSGQNKENFITHLPEDFDPTSDEIKRYPNRAFYSEKHDNVTSFDRNNWLIYKSLSQFDFPLNFGKLTSLTGMNNSQVLARFDSKSLIYNAMLTVNTSTPKAAFIGNDTLFAAAPPIDFQDTDFGFNGSQHKFILKTNYGILTVDAKRRQVHLIRGNQAEELSSEKYRCSQFFKEHLPFKISEYFPQVDVDNAFKGIGLTGVYENKYKRIIITKLDYVPVKEGIVYENNEFYYNGELISLSDSEFFCNKSFTISFSFITMSWVSFHTYLPNVYITWGDEFYTSLNDGKVWEHNDESLKFNNFYGKVEPYIIEYPLTSQLDMQLTNIQDYTKVHKYLNKNQFVVAPNVYFNKAIVYNNEQSTGLLHLFPKQKNNMASYLSYPKYTATGKHIQYVKHENFYQYNTLYDVVIDESKPFFKTDCSSLSYDKTLEISNLEYRNVQFKKPTINGRDVKIRHILDNTSDYKLISEFILANNEKN
jgi:hypothetical protein